MVEMQLTSYIHQKYLQGSFGKFAAKSFQLYVDRMRYHVCAAEYVSYPLFL